MRAWTRYAVLTLCVVALRGAGAPQAMRPGANDRMILPAMDQASAADKSREWYPIDGYDTIPPDFPSISVLINDNPAPGKLFMCPVVRTPPRYTYLTILDENITPSFYLRRSGSMSTFALQPNGLLTFFDAERTCFYAMNESYAIIDSFRCAHGYTTDGHDMQLWANGHALVMAYDSRIIDMSVIVPGGNPAATVTGLVLQELDEAKNVVFEWKSWDHFAITDATHEDLTADRIDYVHANAFDLDTDGNILLSSRHMDEITKINRQTGDIMWRLGGRNNQFIFLNDSMRFSYQHDIRRLANGNITLFDNGNYHVLPVSRAVEYHLDESLLTAERVWEFRNTPDIYAFATGNVQRLPNGNTLISWGTENRITEVRPDGSKSLELALSPSFRNYRTLRFPWTATAVRESPPVPSGSRLSSAYPNPFNPTTTIQFTIDYRQSTVVSVYDMLGREVTTLVNDVKEPGTYSVQWDASAVSSGAYFYTIKAGNFVETKMMVVIR